VTDIDYTIQPTGRSTKRARAKTPAPVGPRVTWQEVVQAIQHDGARSATMTKYREAGFTPDDFNRSRKAREMASDSITSAEDWMEYEHPRLMTERSVMRDVRRWLEWETW
jgi:hypothetical protein